MKEKIHTTAGWDARDQFLGEIVHRLNIYLNSSPANPKEWFENLRDFFSIVYPFLDNKKVCRARIKEIKELLYGTHKAGRKITESEYRTNKEKAYEMIRELFEDMHEMVYKAGIYLPMYEKEDLGKAVLVNR